MGIESIPVIQTLADGTERVVAHITSLGCADCGKLTLVKEMLRDPLDGSYHCVECPGSEYDAAADERGYQAYLLNRFAARGGATMTLRVLPPPIPDAPPTDVRRAVIAVGWVPQVVSERDSLIVQVAIAVGQRDDTLAERDRLADLAASLFARVAELEAAEVARLARLGTRPLPSRPAAWWAALCLLWWEATPARTPRWAWPSMLALLTLALAIVRW